MIDTWYRMEIGLLKTALCSKTCLHFCNTKDFEGILGWVMLWEHVGLDENARWAICMMRSSVFFELRLRIRNPWRDPVFQVGIFTQQTRIECQDLFREWRNCNERRCERFYALVFIQASQSKVSFYTSLWEYEESWDYDLLWNSVSIKSRCLCI